MAKRKKKSKRSGKRSNGNGAGNGVTQAALGNVFGNMLGQLLADGIGFISEKRAKATGSDDTAAKILKCLCVRGPQSLPDLIKATGEGLTPVLLALQTAREFRLVEFVDAGDVITLTPMGSKTVTVVQKEGIREQAARMLEGTR